MVLQIHAIIHTLISLAAIVIRVSRNLLSRPKRRQPTNEAMQR
jgi:hypothetical protein